MSKRHRGFIENYAPRASTVFLLDRVQAVLDLYAAYLPLTIRQIFYRLVGAGEGYRKPRRPTTAWAKRSAKHGDAGLSGVGRRA